jgi:hypothetical protein
MAGLSNYQRQPAVDFIHTGKWRHRAAICR